tara:strand:- start:534 stop:1082 length:549 start_codon:yes stop_codon:yes gene_type:complete
MLPLPLPAAKFLLDLIKEKQKITIEDVENFEENKSETLDDIKNKPRKKSGQGFGLSPKERKAIENYAMEYVVKKFKNENWSVTDVSSRRDKGYDLNLRKDGKELFCEVKGTTGTDSRVIITKNELSRARENYPKFILCIVSGIWLDRSKNPPATSLGKLTELNPWKIDDEKLEPLTYFYNLK